MNFLGKWLGLDWDQFNAWELHWALDDAVMTLGILALVVPLTLWFCWTSLARIGSYWKKTALFGLRVVTLLLAVWVLLQPKLELKNIQPLKNTLAILLDDSKSMTIKTFPQEKARSALVEEFMQSQKKFLDDLKKDYELDFYFASDRLEPVPQPEIPARYRAGEVNTDLGSVFRGLEKQYENRSLQGVILLSDGADLVLETPEPSPEFAEILNRLDGPVHVLQAGTNENFKDLAIEEVEANEFGFVNQPLSVNVTLRASEIGNKKIPLVLKEGDKILVSRTVDLQEEVSAYQVELDFTPVVEGKHIYRLSVPAFAGESVDSNNRWDFEVKVVRDRIRVLHLNGKPSWDSRFLREVLTNNPKVDLLSFFILRTLTDDVSAPTAELSLIPFPSNLLFSDYLGSFDLVIFHNFKFRPFLDKKYLDNIRNYVEQGGAFLMIGGDLSFQEGGYPRTPVEEILPVKFKRNSERFLLGEFPVSIQSRLIHHPILQLEPNQARNKKSWGAMPPLEGLNIGLVPRKDSHVLLQSRMKKGGPVHPVLVSRRVGEGRTVAIANDTSWHWNFHRVGQGGSGRFYQKFWENVLAWMTGDPATLPVQIETDKEKYREYEKVLVSFKFFQEDYNPRAGAKVDLVLESLPDHRELERKTLETDSQGEGRYQFSPGQEGFYSVRATLQSKKTSLSGETRFSMFSPRLEFLKPRVNETLLTTVAQKTGGTHRLLVQNMDLNDIRFPNPEIEIKTRTRFVSLWDNWWCYGLILGLLALEWWGRRKWGLS